MLRTRQSSIIHTWVSQPPLSWHPGLDHASWQRADLCTIEHWAEPWARYHSLLSPSQDDKKPLLTLQNPPWKAQSIWAVNDWYTPFNPYDWNLLPQAAVRKPKLREVSWTRPRSPIKWQSSMSEPRTFWYKVQGTFHYITLSPDTKSNSKSLYLSLPYCNQEENVWIP